jgi:hypothetical protein
MPDQNTTQGRRDASAQPADESPQDRIGVVDPRMHPYGVEIDGIWLGERKYFPIWNTWAKIVRGSQPSVCPVADPQLHVRDLPLVEQRFRELRWLQNDTTIHWVGRQATYETLCHCDVETVGRTPLESPGQMSPHLSRLERAILDVIRARGERMTTMQIVAALETALDRAGEGATKLALAGLVRRELLTNRQDVRPRGYGLPEWG